MYIFAQLCATVNHSEITLDHRVLYFCTLLYRIAVQCTTLYHSLHHLTTLYQVDPCFTNLYHYVQHCTFCNDFPEYHWLEREKMQKILYCYTLSKCFQPKKKSESCILACSFHKQYNIVQACKIMCPFRSFFYNLF